MCSTRISLTPTAFRRSPCNYPIDAKDSVDGNPLWTHNIQYVLAVAAGHRQIVLEHFTAEWTDRPAVLELAARVEVEASDELQSRFPEQNGAVVTVTTAGRLVLPSAELADRQPRRADERGTSRREVPPAVRHRSRSRPIRNHYGRK